MEKNILQNIIRIAANSYSRRKTLLREAGVFSYITGTNGYVLVIVLLVTALMVSISSEFFITAQTDIFYIKKFNEGLKAYTLARAGVDFATFILDADKKGLGAGILPGVNTDKNVDSYKDLWALDFPDLPLEGGTIKIKITDENSKINLSILSTEFADPRYYSMTKLFFANMGLPMDLADTIKDWVDVDDVPSPHGAESSDYYLTLPKPYKAKNNEMDSIQEMLLIKDITPEIFYGLWTPTKIDTNLVDDNKDNTQLDLSFLSQLGSDTKLLDQARGNFKDLEHKIGKEKSRRLSDYFRVNGDRSDFENEWNRININTASFRILSSLTDTMNDDTATEIIRRRQTNVFASVDEIKDLIPDDITRNQYLTVRSYIFRLEIIGIYNNTKVKIVAIYNRETKRFYYMGET
jgi:type II secretory pathway component PulK